MVRPRYLLDTNVPSEPVRLEPDAAVVEKLREHGGELATAYVVWHELAFGVRLLRPSRKRSAIERCLDEVVSAALPILPYDAAAAKWHAEQRTRLAKGGLTPSLADGQVAAVAAVHDLILMTNDVQDFERYPDLLIERWHRASTRQDTEPVRANREPEVASAPLARPEGSMSSQPSQRDGPRFVQYFGPILVALKALGVSARPAEVTDRVAVDLNVSDEAQPDRKRCVPASRRSSWWTVRSSWTCSRRSSWDSSRFAPTASMRRSSTSSPSGWARRKVTVARGRARELIGVLHRARAGGRRSPDYRGRGRSPRAARTLEARMRRESPVSATAIAAQRDVAWLVTVTEPPTRLPERPRRLDADRHAVDLG